MAQKESGYAWFVVFCSFAIHFITDGVAYTFGIFFSEFSKEFQSSKVSGAWVPSIMTGMTLGVGPIASALMNRYGCKSISVAGTTFMAVGFLSSTFATNVTTLYFTIGILAGIGFGLIYLPAIVIITQYFNKRLALATGLAVSASGIGSSLFVPVTEYLIQRLGWRGAMKALSFIIFASGLFGLSFKSFKYDDASSESVSTSEDCFNDEVWKQKMVKSGQKDDLCNDADNEKLMKKDNIEKLCIENGLIKNETQLSQNSLTSVTSNEKHNRIINGHLSNQTTLITTDKENIMESEELDEKNEQEMLIPINEQDSEQQQSQESLDRFEDNRSNEATDIDARKRMDLSTNLLANNLTTSLNTNLNNLNNVSTRSNEVPRLSLDSSANYRLQAQLQQHHRHLQQLKENQILRKQPTVDESSLTIDESNTIDSNGPIVAEQNLNKSHDYLTEPSNQLQYKSFNSLHQNYNLPIMNNQLIFKKPNQSNLNTIVLYSTSMTSINYCCAGNERDGKTGQSVTNSKHSSISSHKLTNVLSTPTQLERVGIAEKNHSNLMVNKQNSITEKPSGSYFPIRRSTLDKMLTVGKYINILLCWNLLRDRIFLWFAISNFLTSLGYYVPYIYIKELCLLLPNMSEQPSDCSYLLSIIGFSSTIGRILFGFMSDFKRFNRIHIYAHCLTLCGLSTVFTIFSHNYYMLAIYSAIFGLTTAAFVSLTTVIIVDLLGPDRVSNAFGLLLLFQGIASLTGPPIVGLLFDYTRSYDAGFTLIGVFIVTSGAMLYWIPCLRKNKK